MQRGGETKLGCGQSSVRPWRRTFSWPERDSGKLSDDSDKRDLAQIVLGKGAELLIMPGILLDLDKQWEIDEWTEDSSISLYC